MAPRHRIAQRKELGCALGRHGAKVFRFADERDRRPAHVGQSIEHLDELQLVVKVVLEPQYDLVVPPGPAKSGIAAAEILENSFPLSPAGLGDELRAFARKLLQDEARPDRSFVQHVAPRQYRSGNHSRQHPGGAIAVGDVQQLAPQDAPYAAARIGHVAGVAGDEVHMYVQA